jgi:RNA polymerase sigma-70 factor (ECF subfamily)
MVHRLDDAEDVFQHAAMTMWEKFDTYQPDTNFAAWATTIARFKALDLLEAHGRARVCPSTELVNQLAQQEEPSTEIREARLGALADCRSRLAKPDQMLLRECYAGSETIAIAASKLGRTPQSVYVSLRRIRRMLLECIQRKLSMEGLK